MMSSAISGRPNAILNRPQGWDQFFENFKRKHHGKKRLIQMASLIGDSAWDLTALMASRRLKREKQEQPDVRVAPVDLVSGHLLSGGPRTSPGRRSVSASQMPKRTSSWCWKKLLF